MIRGEYKAKLKEMFGVSRISTDDLLNEVVLNEVVNDALDTVTDDLNLNMSMEAIGRLKDQWEYPLPDEILSLRGIYYLDTGNEWNPLDYLSPEEFLAGFDEDDSQPDPLVYSVFGRTAEQYWWSTDSGEPVNKFAPEFYVTVENNCIIICYGANFGVIDFDLRRRRTGSRIQQDDVAWNISDDSYGFVDYLDMTTAKVTNAAGTNVTATSTRLSDTGNNFTTANVVAGDVIVRTSDNSYAFVTEKQSDNVLLYTGMQGPSISFLDEDGYKVGTADRVVLKQYGTSGGGLRSGTDHTFEYTDSTHAATSVTVSTDINTGDTLTIASGTFDTTKITTDMICFPSTNDKVGKIRSVTSTVIKVDYWIGGAPTGTITVTFGTGDKFQVESKFRTLEQVWIHPASSENDTNIERIRLLYVRAPNHPDTDDDPIELDDRYQLHLLNAMRWLMADRLGTQSVTEVAKYEAVYRARIANTNPVAGVPTGQTLSVLPSKAGRRRSKSAVWGAGGINFKWKSPY